MLIAEIKMPKLKTRTVWAGIYGGHYDQIVFFSRRPKKGTDKSNPKIYDCLDNKDIICGDIGYGEFEELFPNVNLSKYYNTRGIEIEEVFPLKLTAFWEERYKKTKYSKHWSYKLASFNFHQNWD